jgi:hypothetical protein
MCHLGRTIVEHLRVELQSREIAVSKTRMALTVLLMYRTRGATVLWPSLTQREEAVYKTDLSSVGRAEDCNEASILRSLVRFRQVRFFFVFSS